MWKVKTVSNVIDKLGRIVCDKTDPPDGQRSFYKLKFIINIEINTCIFDSFIKIGKYCKNLHTEQTMRVLINGIREVDSLYGDEGHKVETNQSPIGIFTDCLKIVEDDIVRFLYFLVVGKELHVKDYISKSAKKGMIKLYKTLTIKLKYLQFYMLLTLENLKRDERMRFKDRMDMMAIILSTHQICMNTLMLNGVAIDNKLIIKVTPDLARNMHVSLGDRKFFDGTTHDGCFRLLRPEKVGERYVIWLPQHDVNKNVPIGHILYLLKQREKAGYEFCDFNNRVRSIVVSGSYDVYEHEFRMNQHEAHFYLHPRIKVKMNIKLSSNSIIFEDGKLSLKSSSKGEETHSCLISSAICDLLVDYLNLIRHMARYYSHNFIGVNDIRANDRGIYPFDMNVFFVYKILSSVSSICSSGIYDELDMCITRLIVGYFVLLKVTLLPESLFSYNSDSASVIFRKVSLEKDLSEISLWRNINIINDRLIISNLDVASSMLVDIRKGTIIMELRDQIESLMTLGS